MSRTWTENHIIELIKKYSKPSTPTKEIVVNPEFTVNSRLGGDYFFYTNKTSLELYLNFIVTEAVANGSTIITLSDIIPNMNHTIPLFCSTTGNFGNVQKAYQLTLNTSGQIKTYWHLDTGKYYYAHATILL